MVESAMDEWAPALEPVATIHIELAPPIDLGSAPDGHRRVVPIVGGWFEGFGGGVVLPAGADFQVLVSETITTLHARYVLQADTGARLDVENRGIRTASPEDTAALVRGETVPPDRVYFRSSPRFTTSDGDLAWVNGALFVARGTRHPDEVVLAVFRVM
jgi:Protein of unknown function (DUF3237)